MLSYLALLAVVAIPDLVTSIRDDDVCIEINPGVSNRRLSEAIISAKEKMILNAERPQPELDLPVLDPYHSRLAGPYKVKGFSIEIRDITIQGLKGTRRIIDQTSGKGDARTVFGSLDIPVLKINGKYRVVDSQTSGSISIIAKDVRHSGTGVLAHESLSHANIAASARGGVDVVLSPDLPIGNDDRRSLTESLIRDEVGSVISRFFVNTLERDCNDDDDRDGVRIAIRASASGNGGGRDITKPVQGSGHVVLGDSSGVRNAHGHDRVFLRLDSPEDSPEIDFDDLFD